MEIRILESEEIKNASGLSRYVFDYCLRNRMQYPQTVAFVEDYIAEANLKKLYDACELILWGAFEEQQLVAVSGLQRDGLITLLYVLPQCQNKGYGAKLLQVMRKYAKDVCAFSQVTLNANPAWTAPYFKKQGFSNMNPNQDRMAPFVPMHAFSEDIEGFEKRFVSKGVIALTIFGSVAFATIVGCLYMIYYLF